MPAIIWPDGTLDKADTWFALEQILRRDAWNPSNKDKFRSEMVNRALVYADSELDVRSAKKMFTSLEKCGMLRIVEGGSTDGKQ
jgi:hypothetical protein